MAKFAANNNNFASTKLSQFFALRTLYLYMSIDIINFLDTIIHTQINKKKTINIFEAIWSI